MQNKIRADVSMIKYGSTSYNEELQLRNRVLRIPLGMSLYNENLDNEQNDYHIGAFIDNCLVGVLILTKQNVRDVKMRQVAVEDGMRRMGIGAQLVTFAENYCTESGYNSISLNARITAVHFYLQQGYTIKSGTFLEIGIPHIKMNKILIEL